MVWLLVHTVSWASVLALAFVSGSVHWDATTLDLASAAVPLWAMCAFRAVAALIGVGLLASMAGAEGVVIANENLDGKLIPLLIGGWWQLQSYTVWGWCLMTLYFCVATAVSVTALLFVLFHPILYTLLLL